MQKWGCIHLPSATLIQSIMTEAPMMDREDFNPLTQLAYDSSLPPVPPLEIRACIYNIGPTPDRQYVEIVSETVYLD